MKVMMVMVVMVMVMVVATTPAAVPFQISLGKNPMQVKIRPGQTIVAGPGEDDHDDEKVLSVL